MDMNMIILMIMMMLMAMMLLMMMNDVHFDIPLLANFKKLQRFHDSGAEQHQGCTERVLKPPKQSRS